MKRVIFILGALCTLGASAYAQDDAQKAAADAAAAIANAPKEEAPAPKPKYWDYSTVFDLGINQTSLFSWAAGGVNNITLNTGLDAKLHFNEDRISWKNRLQLEYGFIWSEDKSYVLQKSKDRIYFESKFSYSFTNKTLKWTASYDFRSQFTDSYTDYDYPEKWYKDMGKEPGMEQHYKEEMEMMKSQWKEQWDEWRRGSIKSTFLSPAYNNLALGIEWKPTQWFDITVSPLTASVVIVTEPVLRERYGMPANANADPFDVYPYYSALFQLGASVKANAKFSINDRFNYETQLVLFTDYLNSPFVQNRVNWDNKITWQLAKFFKVGLSTWLLYDPIVDFDNTLDGVQRKVQFKEYLSFNFTFLFGNKDLK
ncbi:MAG: DUF3078 domain-containing protein [Bacteroidales bacterium]|nr:DUF3078 domain-containing protein [Bacteroidales bacterium]